MNASPGAATAGYRTTPLPWSAVAQPYWALIALEAAASNRILGLVLGRAGLGYRILLEEFESCAFVPAPGELWPSLATASTFALPRFPPGGINSYWQTRNDPFLHSAFAPSSQPPQHTVGVGASVDLIVIVPAIDCQRSSA